MKVGKLSNTSLSLVRGPWPLLRQVVKLSKTQFTLTASFISKGGVSLAGMDVGRGVAKEGQMPPGTACRGAPKSHFSHHFGLLDRYLMQFLQIYLYIIYPSKMLAPLPTLNFNSVNFYKSVIDLAPPIPLPPFNFKIHQIAYFFENFPGEHAPVTPNRLRPMISGA